MLSRRLRFTAILVAITVCGLAGGGHARTATTSPAQAGAQTLGSLLSENGLGAPRIAGVALDRAITNHVAFENAADLFCAVWYWPDEVKDGYPNNFHVLLLDKATGKWVSRVFNEATLPARLGRPADMSAGWTSLGAFLRVRHSRRWLLLETHRTPSAGNLLVLSRDLEPKALIWGWVLFVLPDESFVYHRSQVHLAPTHRLEVAAYDPASGLDRVIYPTAPYDPPRLAFMQKMKQAYDAAGSDWCRDHNHYCDPELFDSSYIGQEVVDSEAGAFAFLVQFGNRPSGRENTPDDSVPAERVAVACSPISAVRRIVCTEQPLASLKAMHPDLAEADLLRLAAHERGTTTRRAPN